MKPDRMLIKFAHKKKMGKNIINGTSRDNLLSHVKAFHRPMENAESVVLANIDLGSGMLVFIPAQLFISLVILRKLFNQFEPHFPNM